MDEDGESLEVRYFSTVYTVCTVHVHVHEHVDV